MTNLEHLLDPATVEVELAELEALALQDIEDTKLRTRAGLTIAASAIRELHKRNEAARDQVAACVAALEDSSCSCCFITENECIVHETCQLDRDDCLIGVVKKKNTSTCLRCLTITNLAAVAAAHRAAIEAPLRAEIEALQRVKYGTPCKCESWVETCRNAEEENDKLRQEIARLRDALNKWKQHLPNCRTRKLSNYLPSDCDCGYESTNVALTPDDGWLERQLAAAKRAGAREALTNLPCSCRDVGCTSENAYTITCERCFALQR